MNARPLVSVLLLVALGLERFAYYGFRANFTTVLVARGVEPAEALGLYSSFTNTVTLLPIAFGCIAIVVPRVWMAPVGGLIALAAYVAAIVGPQSTFSLAIVALGIGAAIMKATVVCAAADFVDSPRARTVVGVVAYGLMNLGALVAPLVASEPESADFSRAPAIAAAMVLLLCGSAAVLGLVLPKAPPTPGPTAQGLIGVLLLIPVSSFLWLMVESQPYDLDVPPWGLMLNSLLIMTASLMGAIVLGLVPARAMGRTLLAVLALCFLFAAGGVVGLKNRDPSLWIGVQLLLTIAEVGLGMLVFALAVGSTPPRFAPLSIAMVTLGTAVAASFASKPENVRVTALVVFGVVSVMSLGLFTALFRFTLGPLGRAETVGAPPT